MGRTSCYHVDLPLSSFLFFRNKAIQGYVEKMEMGMDLYDEFSTYMAKCEIKNEVIYGL